MPAILIEIQSSFQMLYRAAQYFNGGFVSSQIQTPALMTV